VIVEEAFDIADQTYHLTRVHHIGDVTLRVRVHRDAYERQSHAVVEVLTPALTWTPLAAEPTGGWYDASPSSYARPRPGASALYPVADRLLQRARTILRA
jgi:hypothetical protein